MSVNRQKEVMTPLFGKEPRSPMFFGPDGIMAIGAVCAYGGLAEVDAE
jgi:hypothetical protein